MGVLIVYGGDPSKNMPELGTATAAVTLAPAGGPLASIQTADPNAPIPRFVDASVVKQLFSIVPEPILDQTAQQPTATIPNAECVSRVFVSYSWESEDHRKWVLALATRLRQDGVEAMIDQTHLPLGARSPEFMERSVRESGCVLVVCTEIYKQRFDNRKGGAGYEGHIITGEIINEVGENKFIPVLRSGERKNAVPSALVGIHGVDLSKDSEDEYRRLVKQLHGISNIPPIGPPPKWLNSLWPLSDRPAATRPATAPDPTEFQQRKSLPETDTPKNILSKTVSSPSRADLQHKVNRGGHSWSLWMIILLLLAAVFCFLAAMGAFPFLRTEKLGF